jgi:putative ABC transport system permease protein
VVADFVVTAPSGLAPSVTEEVRAADGVAGVTPVVRSQVFVKHLMAGTWETTPYAAQGVDPAGLTRTLDLVPRDGDMNSLRDNTVALSTMAAETVGVGVGDEVEVYLGDGTVAHPKVVATYQRGLGFGDLTLPHDVLIAHTTSRLDQSILVDAEDTGAAQRSLAEIPGVVVADRAALATAGQAERDANSWVSLIALLVILGYVAIAVVNTLVMATAARSREFALLRLVGTGKRQVRRMTLIESLVVIAIAVVVGSLAAVPPLVGLSLGMTESPIPAITPLAYLGIVGATGLLGLLAIGVPTRLALRARPITAIA